MDLEAQDRQRLNELAQWLWKKGQENRRQALQRRLEEMNIVGPIITVEDLYANNKKDER